MSSIALLVLVGSHGFGAELHAAPDDAEVPDNAAAPVKRVHLFLLSGQSNMAGMDPALVFTPGVQKLLGAKNVVVVKVAQKGQPIRRWYKKWVVTGDQSPDRIGDLYDALMNETRKALAGRVIKTATFIWMQGEKDAKERLSEFYEESLLGVIEQIKSDLDLDTLNIIIGRLSDNAIGNLEWDKIREIQMAVADSSPNAVWIDTDDLNKDKSLHYTPEGYDELARRYVEKVEILINQKNSVEKE